MTKRPEPNPLVMLNLFQHLVGFFLLSADASFVPVHRKGFSDAILINETPWTEVQGFFRATRLRRIACASLRAPFIPRFKSLGFSGRFYKDDYLNAECPKSPSIHSKL
jgi:hypothetical protein